MPKISIVMGTRPEIIKLSPIIRLAKKRNTDVIFSGQHYDYDMGLRFIDELKLPEPDFTMKLTKNNPAKQLGQMIQELSDRFLETKPDTVIVQGDTNTVLAGAFAALKNNIPVSHVEAGLRSFDWRMPEEHNRIATDHVSEILFASTDVSRKNLVNEHVHGKIFVVGNTAIDAIEYNLGIAEKHSSVNVDGKFALLTLHRAENVDDKNTLSGIMSGVIKSGQKFVFPVHPRTKKRLYEFGLYDKIRESNIVMIDSVGYFDILLLMKRCDFIVTDSGGIQEEATSRKIRKKVLVARTSTDRPEAVEAGFSEVIGVHSNNIQKSIRRTVNLHLLNSMESPYGNGKSAEKILRIISQYF